MQVDSDYSILDSPEMEEDIEQPSPVMVGTEAIRLRGVYKTYTALLERNTITALKGISLDIYEGQITAIVGRNGAGKTTLLNILLGLTSPTEGKATVYGYDTSCPFGMAEIRKIAAPCFQFDLYYPNLTIDEHLMFFGRLRGLEPEQVYSASSKMLAKLNLEGLRGTHAKHLSGGQKRKLSVAIALIGDPLVVLLDEPTAGMEPSSRRNLWDLLRSRKQGRVIVLTTHFMDEADILADRKAIIHEGVVRCVGSSLFLKNRFGVGYNLVVELRLRVRDTSNLDRIIRKYAPEALGSKEQFTHTVVYSLPIARAPSFPDLLSEIEEEIKDGGPVRSIGMELTTLEEVFLRIAYNSGFRKEQTEEFNLLEQDVRLSPSNIVIMLMLAKLRLYRLVRSLVYLFLLFIVPIIIVLVAFTVVANYHTEIKPPQSGSEDVDGTVAVRQGSTGFQHFLNKLKVKQEPFSGDMKNFWKATDKKGDLLGAIAIDEDHASATERYLTAHISANGKFLHSQPKLLDLVCNYFNSLIGSGSAGGATVLQREGSYDGRGEAIQLLVTNAFTFFLFGTAICFASSAVATELVRDKEIEAMTASVMMIFFCVQRGFPLLQLKTQQLLRLNGVTFWLYYGSLFFTFGLLLLTLVLVLLLIAWITSDGKVVNVYAIIWAGILLGCSIPAQLVFASIFATKQSSTSSAEVSYLLMVVFLGVITTVFMMAIDILATFCPEVGITTTMRDAFHIVLSVFNVFYIPGIIFYWMLREYAIQRIHHAGEHPEPSFGLYNTSEIRLMLFCSLAQTLVLFLLLYKLDHTTKGCVEALKKMFWKQGAASTRSLGEETREDDVEEEVERVNDYFHSTPTDSSVVVAVKDLWKSYPNQSVLHGISFMVGEGEILGLLGHTGAGKTTSIRIMTGEEIPDAGHVQMCGHVVEPHHWEAFKQLGFCPQHDAVWENITLSEHLELYAVLHGVSIGDSKRLISDILMGLSLEEHRNKYSQKLSSGTKRKLCYAMSIIGFPRIVIMDEPTTGLDPCSKWYLWNTILGTIKGSRGAILTTHSMEEADFLCTRIAVIVDGKIVAIDTAQNLKNKFGSGYTLEIKLKPTETEALLEEKPSNSRSRKDLSHKSSKNIVPADLKFVTESFRGGRLLEAFGNRAVFSVPISAIQSVSQAFSTLEDMKATQHIEDYSFSQNTGEQIYLTICRGVEENK